MKDKQTQRITLEILLEEDQNTRDYIASAPPLPDFAARINDEFDNLEQSLLKVQKHLKAHVSGISEEEKRALLQKCL